MKSSSELRKELREAEARERAEAGSSANKVLMEYTWSLDWTGDRVFRVTKKLSDQTLWRIEQWKKDHPEYNDYPYSWNSQVASHSYVLVDKYLVAVGGGTLLLRSTPDGVEDVFSHEPRMLTEEEAYSLCIGDVPDSLKLHG